MRTIIAALLLSAISAIAADTPIAVVKGTNVLGTAIADTNRFVPPTGASNIVIDLPLVGIVQKGWSYSGGVFRNQSGQVISGDLLAYVNREKLIETALTVMDDMQSSAATADANWATLTAVQKDAAARKVMLAVAQLSEIVELLTKQQRALLQTNVPTQ